jgi:hypothetical protein
MLIMNTNYTSSSGLARVKEVGYCVSSTTQ